MVERVMRFVWKIRIKVLYVIKLVKARAFGFKLVTFTCHMISGISVI